MIPGYDIMLLTWVYTLFFSVIVRVVKLGHVTGFVIAIAFMLSYCTHNIVCSLIPYFTEDSCIWLGCVTLILSNFIIDFKIK